MKCRVLTVLYILTACVSSGLYGQGRVDSDRILYHIESTTIQIDNNNSLRKEIKTDGNSTGKNFQVYYYDSDTLCKVSKLINTKKGTELTSFYFDKGKPICISVKRNNYELTGNIKDVNKAIGSFDFIVDTLPTSKNPYKPQYSASYYFHNDKVRFAAIVIFSARGDVEKVRHDKQVDIIKGMKLYATGRKYKMELK